MNKDPFTQVLTLLFLGLSFLQVLQCSDNVSPPQLSGAWKSGSTTMEFQNGDTWFQVRVWYPTEEESQNKILSSDPYTIRAFSEVFGIPVFLLGDPVASRSGSNVKIAPGVFPVILFNHGLLSYERQNTLHFEQLASHGYIVLSVSTPGESAVVVRENGEAVYMSKEGVAYAAYRNQAADANEIAPGLKRHVVQAKASATFPEYAERMSDLAHDPTFSNMLPLMDRVFQNNVVLLNRLTDINNGTSKYEISGHMDLEHVGAFGHSFGSIISGMLAMEDRRIKAAIGLDAPQLNVRPAQYTPFRIPVCYAYADELTLGDETISFSGLNRPLLSAKGSCEALFKKSAHYNFTDLNQVKFLRYTPMLGNVDNALMAANLDALLLAFFDTHLKGKDELRALRLEGVELNLY